MSRYSRCPHQNASGTATLAPLHQPQLRNPWVAADRAGESQSTNSSSSSRTYRGPGGGGGGGGGGGTGPPPPLWHAPPPPLPADHFNHHPVATHPRATHYLVDHQLEVLDGPGAAHAATHLLAPPGPGRPPPPPHAPQPQPYAASSRAASERDRPVTPASSPGGASGSAGGGAGGGGAAAVDGCGGHCVAFENFCYRLLQVIFIAGILTGISLTIAGSVLRHAPSRTLSPSPSSSSSNGVEGGGGGGGRDKAVLVYIGCLVGLVCALLLAVQCCVRRNVKRRKRALRMSMAAGRRGLAAHAHAHAHASAGTLPHPHAHAHAHPHVHAHAAPASAGVQQGHLAHGGDIPLQELQYQPLLVRLVQQQATASSSSSGNQRLAAASAQGPAPAHYHRPGHAAPAAYRDDVEELDASCSGTPWWRRRGDPRHTRQPHVADTRR